MMAIMLDPCFKSLHIVKKLVGCGNVIWLAFEYDVKVVVFVLMVCFDRLNPITIASIVATFNLVKSKFEKKLLCGGFN